MALQHGSDDFYRENAVSRFFEEAFFSSHEDAETLGEQDVVALVLPNSVETATATIGGAIAGIVNPVNPLLEPEHIGAILRETGAKVVVTLKSFPKTDIAQKTAEAVRHAPQVHTVLEIDLNPAKLNLGGLDVLHSAQRKRTVKGEHARDGPIPSSSQISKLLFVEKI